MVDKALKEEHRSRLEGSLTAKGRAKLRNDPDKVLVKSGDKMIH